MSYDERGKYFFLSEDCFLVKGAKRGAIYNVTSGDVFSVNPIMTEFLYKCENQMSLKQLFKNIIPANIKRSEIINYLNELEKLGLGDFYENKVAIIKIKPIKKDSLIEKVGSLNFLWLKITEDCNLNCVHCNMRNLLHFNLPSCRVDKRKHEANVMKLSDWKQFIKDIDVILGCETLQIIGGEPLLYSEEVLSIIKFVKNLKFINIELFTNGTLFNKELINLLVRNRVTTIIPIYSVRREIHDEITRKAGSFDETLKNIQEIKDRGGKVSFHLVILKNNKDFLEETIEFYKNMNIEISNYSIDLSINSEEINTLIPKNLYTPYINKPHFKQVNFPIFFTRKDVNECCNGKLAINNDGNLFPCILSTRKELIGNVKNNSIINLMRSQNYEKYWEKNKDEIEICNQCEYRYACHHCRICETKFFVIFDSKRKFCTYNPIEGEWA